MFNPNIGGHGLEAWGERLGYAKGEHVDFSEYTPEMLRYCQRDVRLTALLYIKLTERMRREGISELACKLEHQAWHIIQNKQKQNGFPIDQEKADLLYAELRQREAELKEEIYRLWPPVLQIVRRFAKSRKSDGTRTANYLRHLGEYPKLEDNEDGSYHAYDYVEFDLGSPQQRIQKLLALGWKPVNFTKKGSPKIDEDEMLAFAETSGVTEAKALARWCVVNSRANMVRNWIEAVNPKTGHIHGSLFLAATGRYKHSSPNTANIPGVRDGPDGHLMGEAGTWAYECRSLWTAGGKGWKLVGIDAQGIQLRILAHYLNNEDFSKAILSADPHSENQRKMGLSSRSLTKTITYATLMGAGDKRVAVTAGVSLEEAKVAKEKFNQQIPELPTLINKLKRELNKTGRITSCSGTRHLVASDHMVIPYLLQADEASIMKQTLVLIDQEVRRRGWSADVLYVGNIHDELQIRVRDYLADEFVSAALPCFVKAGELFNYRVPIEGSAKIGDNWACTH